MALKSLKQFLWAKVETSYGVDPVPVGTTDAMLVSNVKINPLNATEIERKVLATYFSHQGLVVADYHVQLDFDVEVAGAGAAGTAPKWGVLMKGCAMAETISSGVSVTYTPATNNTQSLTLYLNIDGKLRKVSGALGNMKAKFTAKGVPMMSFTFLGLYSAPVDSLLFASSVSAFLDPVGVSAINTTCSLHGVALPISDFSFDVGNKNVFRSLINLQSVVFTDRAATGSVVMEDVLVATKAFDAICIAGTTGALALTHGTVAGNKVQFNAPSVELHKPQLSESDNIEMLTMSMAFQAVAGNDEFSIVVL